MPIPDEIQPALTPEEWAAQSIHPFGDRSWVHIDTGPDRIEFGARDGTGNVFEKYWIEDADDKFKLLALSNAALPDGDPRKITQADVRNVEDAIGTIMMGVRVESLSIQGLWDLAAKLAGLLPPNA